ncbi:hypothetical protein BCR34DRAFT_582493 [Clohesyomyces aquaticus]|uniref:Uncharacterized protein n=1 Tax=Clohesyomyces aquaticus TaxID=1231657 RepID=A0A1Y2A8S0_9PLEO|nr:hypothetical protein BCR34DRAFT_582493 [Clohesyomyces aquaticus]
MPMGWRDQQRKHKETSRAVRCNPAVPPYISVFDNIVDAYKSAFRHYKAGERNIMIIHIGCADLINSSWSYDSIWSINLSLLLDPGTSQFDESGNECRETRARPQGRAILSTGNMSRKRDSQGMTRPKSVVPVVDALHKMRVDCVFIGVGYGPLS